MEVSFGYKAPRPIWYFKIQTGNKYIQFNWWRFSLFIGSNQTPRTHKGCGGQIVSRLGLKRCMDCGQRVWGDMIE